MKTQHIFLLLFALFFSTQIFAQSAIHGKVYEQTPNGKAPLVNANIYWTNTTEGTISDAEGHFELKQHKGHSHHSFVVSFVGYQNDTISVAEAREEAHVEVILKSNSELDEITITKRSGGSYTSKTKTVHTEMITSAGLEKLPCCNLSESFENSAAVDVSFADAVTGAKQIRMLGLAGVYTQILSENMPSIRGMASTYGLAYIPGSWMESIQISKGTAAVINGFESITGQINVEYKKPQKSRRLYADLYGNTEGRLESNLNTAWKINEHVSSMILVHASQFRNTLDHNGDGFMDLPLTRQLNFINRWRIEKHGKWESQFGVKIMNENRDGGQMAFDPEQPAANQSYGIGIDTRRYEAFAKVGSHFSALPNSSLGSTFRFTHHNQNSFFGERTYNGTQNSFYGNVIFSTIIGNTDHKLSTGASFQYDDYEEFFEAEEFLKTESVPGVFAQYTHTREKLNLILGVRADFHNTYGVFFTPRFHAKYKITETTALRSSAGKGYRTANVFVENLGLLASSRQWIFSQTPEMEEAWNYGLSFTHDILLSHQREINFSIDFYRTDFINQVIADVDKDATQVFFYNLKGKSFSNSFQANVSAEPLKRLNITAAFRFTDVQMTTAGQLRQKPFVSRYKGLLTFSYATRFDKWQFDITNQFHGKRRLPEIAGNPYREKTEAPAYYILHTQITRRFKHFEIYAGAENLTGFKQENPVVNPENPFGEYFDSSIVWGPLTGRMFYAGLRIKIQ